MANQPKVGGVHTYTHYKKEVNYKEAVTPDEFFGLETNFSVVIDNELNPRRGSGGVGTSGRNIAAFAPGTRRYNITQDFDVTDFKFMEFVLGKVDTTSGPAGKKYTTTDNSVSATIAHCIDDVTTDQDNIFTGCVAQTCSIRAALNDVVTASLGIDAAHGQYDSTLTSKGTRPTSVPYKFVDSAVQYPTGVTLPGVFDSLDISVNNNYKLHYGSAIEAQYATKNELNVDIRASFKHIDSTALNKALGGDGTTVASPTEEATLLYKLKRGEKYVYITAKLAPEASYTLTSAINQPVSEEISITASDVEIIEDD